MEFTIITNPAYTGAMKHTTRLRAVGLLLVVGIAGYLFSTQVLSEGTYANLGTTNSQDGSNDALTWDQGNALTIDPFGKYIALIQGRTGPTTNFTWSNDGGTTWVQSAESYTALTRGSVAYDSKNDKLHVIWIATNTSDGIIYRRYGITRDGSHNITAIAREDAGGINLQLDTSSACNLEHPSAIWKDDGSANGILIAVWSKHSCAGVAQVRGSMRRLSLSAADGVAGNWLALDGTPDTFASEAPAVPADSIHSGTQGAVSDSVVIRGGSGARKDDLYVFVNEYNSGGTDEIFSYRGVWNTGSSDWSSGWQSPVTVGAADNSGGYSLKYQLLSKAVLDAATDKLYISWARWKGGGDGDTVSLASLDSTDTPSALVDVYAALGTHSYAPTMGLAFDSTLGQAVIAYIESTTNGDNGSIDYKTYDGSTLSAPIRFYTSPGGVGGANGSADIPVLYPQRVNDTLLLIFRVNGALPPTISEPHTVLFGTEALPTPTPTPTPIPTPTPTPTATPTPTPTPTPETSASDNSSNSQTSSEYFPPTCSAEHPSSAPKLFRVDRSGSDALLWIEPGGAPYTGLTVWYGETAAADTYTDSYDQPVVGGMITREIHFLNADVAYIFRVQAKNDCAPSEFSNSVTSAKQKKSSFASGVSGAVSTFVQQIGTTVRSFPKPTQEPSAMIAPEAVRAPASPAPVQVVQPTPAPTPPLATTPPVRQQEPTGQSEQPASFGFWDWVKSLFGF